MSLLSEQKAKETMNDAKAKLHELSMVMRAQIESSNSSARERGEKRGLKEAESILGQLSDLREATAVELESRFVHLSSEVAKKLLEEEVRAFPHSVLRVARKVLVMVPDASRVNLRAHPADAALLKENKAELVNSLEHATDIDIRSDSSIQRGGLLIQTEAGLIDAQLNTQLDELTKNIR